LIMSEKMACNIFEVKPGVNIIKKFFATRRGAFSFYVQTVIG